MTRALVPLTVIVALAAGTVAFTQSFSVPLGGGRGPTQPIAFSHEQHAGKMGIDCLYCHYGADKSPIANIPPVGTCMGCHKIAMASSPEVKKLTGYWERGEPVPWVEVYKLPDHVKFNHKRHVKKGIQCTECHGKVQEMAVLTQAPSLKMGWCLSCHRQHVDDEALPSNMDCVACHH